MSSEPEPPRPSPARYPLAVLVCGVWFGAGIAATVALASLFFDTLDGWAQRQVWGVRTFIKIAFYILIAGSMGLVAGGTSMLWARIVHGPTPEVSGATFGRHAKWHPGYTPDPTRSPKCEFNYSWDGTTCGHCGYGAATD